MITLDEAKALALDALSKTTGLERNELAFLDGREQCKRYGWILLYNTRSFIETGDVLDALGGNGPVVVSHDGKVFPLGSASSAEETIAAFERERGWSG